MPRYRTGPHTVTAEKFDPKAETWPEGVTGPFKCPRRGCIFYLLAPRAREPEAEEPPPNVVRCRGGVELFAGQWVVTFADGRRMTADDSLLAEHFVPVDDARQAPASPESP